MMRLSCLYINDTPQKGRGVFTAEPIAANEIVETAPVIVMQQKDRLLLDQTPLHDYIFEWGEEKKQCAMALGWIPVYNHAAPANCEYFMDYETEVMFVKAVRNIEAGEELCVNYNGDFNNHAEVWFETK
jgi:uncharacterized protein